MLQYNGYSQVDFNFDCRTPVVWEGVPAPTFCFKTGPNPPQGSCTTTLGGTIHHSTQLPSNILTGVVCITGGNFSITANTEFTFQNATVYIAPNVAIIVENGATFNLDNASLHGCDGLWQGIRLLDNAQIHTDNNTLIEDAYQAINAKYVLAALEIVNTTFNRNVTGIWLEHEPFAPNPPFISRLENATFKCDGPIVGTNDVISTYGIYALNNPMIFNISPDVSASTNQFRGLKYGIKIEGQPTVLKGNRFWFREIYYSCIEVEKGDVEIRNSFFLDFGDNGIRVNGLHHLKVDSCRFQIVEDAQNYIPAPSASRSAISISSIADKNYPLEVKADIFGSTFTYDCPNIENEVYVGVQISLPFVKRKVLIRNGNVFSLSGLRAYGISLFGSLNEADAESTEIFDNDFVISAPHNFNAQVAGISVGGAVSNLHIVSNYFVGHVENNEQSPPSLDYGVLFQNVIGQNNKIIGNAFNYDFFAGLEIVYSTDVAICSNRTFFCRGFYLIGDNPGTDFNRNQFTVGELAIQGIIGLQKQKDNVFYDVGLLGACRATCLSGGNCAVSSLFEVRQILGSEYYPFEQKCGTLNIDCDADGKFFRSIPGTSSPSCADEIQDPGDISMMLSVAQSNIDNVNEYLFKRYFYESWLYRKLLGDPVLTNSNPAFVNFLQVKAGSTVGQFVNVDNLAQSAIFGPSTFDIQLATLANSIDLLKLQMEAIDQQLKVSITASLMQSKANLLAAWQSATQQFMSASVLRAMAVSQQLQNAIVANNAIVPSTVFESNQKTVNTILFNTFLNGPSPLLETDKAALNSISGQCFKNSGTSVFQSIGFLPICSQGAMNLPGDCEMALFPPTLTLTSDDRSSSNRKPAVENKKLSAYVSGEELLIYMPQDFEGLLSITDINGREWFEKRVKKGEQMVRVDIQAVKPGILFIAARNHAQTLSSKVGVFH